MRLDHVNIATPDADAAAALFRELFDLGEPKRTTVAEQGVKVVKLDAGAAAIEFTEPAGPQTPVGRFLAKRGAGLHHLCFAVPNLRAATARLRERGVRFVDDTPRIGAAGLPIVFLHPASCGGVLVELVERPGA